RNPALAILHPLNDPCRLTALRAIRALRRVHYLLAICCLCDFCHSTLLAQLSRERDATAMISYFGSNLAGCTRHAHNGKKPTFRTDTGNVSTVLAKTNFTGILLDCSASGHAFEDLGSVLCPSCS